jgi:hypothetical protein
MSYTTAVLTGGVIIPVVLHVIAPQSMPWWPDTAATAIAFGAAAVLMVSRYRTDRGINRRLWQALKALVGRARS